jgi:pimeloyl-ACP methyl ester carboxylesterase
VTELIPPEAPEPLPPELQGRIRRDIERGRRLVLVTWVAAIACLALGLISIRQAALLVSVDRHLVTTEEIEATGSGLDLARSVLLVTLVVGAILALRWLRGILPTFEELRRRGVVDGPSPSSVLSSITMPWRPAGVSPERASWAELRVGSGGTTLWAAVLAVVAAASVGVVAALALGAATEASDSRLWRLVTGIDGALWLIALVLVGAAIDGARWREAAAARALGEYIALADAPGPSIVRMLPALLLFGAGVLVVGGRPDPWYVPCPSASLHCDGMLVPTDHDGGSSATIWVAYAVHRASVTPKGTMAIAVGGPGGSGLAEARSRLESFDPDLVEQYDLLFWDQRGVGASEGRDCPVAGFAYAVTEPTAASSHAFVDACLQEAGVAGTDVARYGTRQAAEDLESIRDQLGLDRLTLYGESYGTELAQAYAARHPDRLTALILDGAVDLTRSANEFWAAAATSFDRTLNDTFAACRADRDCRTDAPDVGDEYDRALARFDTMREVSFADADGTMRGHPVDAAAIEAAVGQLLYEPAGRSLILRAVAAAGRGDDVPLARLTSLLGSGQGPGISEFIYHAVTCADYRVSPTADAHDIAAVDAYARQHGIPSLRSAEVYSSQYPCLSWPYQPATGDRPAPLTSTPYPVFVLGAADDPITPIEGARAIAGRLSDSFLITTRGGPHVTFGRGDPCVDNPVLAWVLDERRPANRIIDCPGDVIDGYVGLTPDRLAGYDTALTAMKSAETELFADPDVSFWDGAEELRVGCRHGGYFTLTDLTVTDAIRFADCQFVDGLPLTGIGSYDLKSGALHWEVTVPDGSLTYDSVGSTSHVAGRWKGKDVDLRN